MEVEDLNAYYNFMSTSNTILQENFNITPLDLDNTTRFDDDLHFQETGARGEDRPVCDATGADMAPGVEGFLPNVGTRVLMESQATVTPQPPSVMALAGETWSRVQDPTTVVSLADDSTLDQLPSPDKGSATRMIVEHTYSASGDRSPKLRNAHKFWRVNASYWHGEAFNRSLKLLSHSKKLVSENKKMVSENKKMAMALESHLGDIVSVDNRDCSIITAISTTEGFQLPKD